MELVLVSGSSEGTGIGNSLALVRGNVNKAESLEEASQSGEKIRQSSRKVLNYERVTLLNQTFTVNCSDLVSPDAIARKRGRNR
jgi:hypothetical protein